MVWNRKYCCERTGSMDVDSKPRQPSYVDTSTAPQPPHREAREPSTLLLTLLGLGVVTVIFGIMAFWYAASVRRMEAAVVEQQALLATMQAQIQSAAAQAESTQAEAQATVEAVEAKLAAAEETSAAYSRVVRANQLANNALLTLDVRPQAALLLAIESVRVQQESGEAPLPESIQRLRSLLGAAGGIPLPTGKEASSALTVSEDNRWVAAGDEAGMIRLWDLEAGGATPRLLMQHDGPVWDLLFDAGAQRLYSAGEDGSVLAWAITDIAAAAPLQLLAASQSPQYVLAIAPDKQQLASAGADGTVRLWRTDADHSLGTSAPLELRGHGGSVNTLAFSPDGRLLGSAGDDATIRLWDTQTGAQRAVLTGHDGFINLITFSPNGEWLASGGSDAQVRLWHIPDVVDPDRSALDTPAQSQLLAGHDLGVYALRFSPDGRWLASADDNGGVRLWNVAQPQDNVLLGRHQGNVRGLAFARGERGPILVSTGYDGEVRLWDYGNPDAAAVVIRGHDGEINVLAEGAAERGAPTDLLVTAGYDHSLRVWHTTSPFAEPHRVLRAGSAVADVAVNPSGTQLAAYATDDEAIQIWDVQSGERGLLLERGDAPISALAYDRDGATLWSGSRDGAISHWDAGEGALLRRFRGSEDAISSLAASPDGGLLASGGEDGMIRLWTTEGELLRVLPEQDDPIESLAFSADGATLVSAGAGALRLWDVTDGSELQVLQGPEQGLSDVALQPQGPWLAGAGRDNAVWVWNADALAFEPAQLLSHSNEVNAVNFSADGRLLASAGADAAVYLWDTANPSGEPDTLVGHRSSVNGVSFAPDGTWVATGSADGTIRIWSLSPEALVAEACRTAGRNFTLEEWTRYFPTDVSRYRKTCPMLEGPGA
jgi:WD40 repeat protein